MIDIDKLVKLIRLANDNSNEYEANAAARKVCKMLMNENKEFIFGITPKTVRQEQSPKTWKDVTRSKEPMWTSQYPNYYHYYDESPMDVKDDFWEEIYGSKPFKESAKSKNPTEHRTYVDPKTDSRKYSDITRTLKCTKCNKDKETKFVGLPEVYVCGTCQWKRIHESKT